MNKRLLVILFAAFSILLTSPLSHSAQEDKEKPAERNWLETKWDEPVWSETSTEPLLLRFNARVNTKGRYLEKRNFIVSGKGKPTRGEQTVSSEYLVMNGGENDPIKTRVKWHRLASRGSGSNLMRFFKNSSSIIANYSMSPYGEFSSSDGYLPLSSLPVFPEEEVKVGSRWMGESTFAFSPAFPFLLANGKLKYQVDGVAWVAGSQWVDISFKGELDLPRSGIIIRKIIGIKKSRKPLGSLKGALVGKVAPGLPGETAGIEPEDLILRYNYKKILNWSDLKYAISTSEGDGPYDIQVRRHGRRTTLSITPEIALRGVISGYGRVNGRAVFDVTKGVLVRLVVSPLSMRIKINAKGLKIEQKVVLKAVTELLGVEFPEGNAPPSAVPPEEVKAVEPVEPAAAEPREVKAVEPVEPAAAAPLEPKELEPAAPTEPKVAEPGAPEVVKAVESVEPAATAPREVEAIEPIVPAAATPTEVKVAAPTEPAAPEVAAPAEPKASEPVAPIAAAPTEPKVAEPSAPEVVKAVEPTVAAPAEVKVAVPTEPAASEKEEAKDAVLTEPTAPETAK